MARTPLLHHIRHLLQAAQRANRLSLPDSAIPERLEQDHAHRLHRRRLLQTAAMAAATTAAPLPPAVAAAPPSTATPVIIIGAGAAGMAAAYTLKRARIPFTLYEGATRIGGRIFTLKNFNTDRQFVELGAELVDSDHTALAGLARAVLGADALQEFAGPDTLGADMFFFAGTLRSQADFIAGVRPLLAQIEADRARIYRGLDPDKALITADWPGTSFVREIDRLSVADYLARYGGRVDPWVRQALTVAYTGDMGAEIDRQSALNLVDAIDTNPDTDGFQLFGGDEAHRVRGGNSQLIDALYRHVFDGRDSNATLQRGHTLVAVAQNSGATRFTLTFTTGGRTREIPAGQLVLAIPGTMLRSVEGLAALELDPLVKRQIAELGYGTNSKIMLGFSQRFWRQGHNGRPANEGSLYTDLASQNIWETSRRQPGGQGVLTTFLGGEAGLRASEATGAQTQADLATVYGDARLGGAAGRTLCWNWNTMPFVRASYSCPAPGQFTGFWGRMAQPQLGGRLLFAGEHTSTTSWGFMNGAYESGIRAARQVAESRQSAPAPRAG